LSTNVLAQQNETQSTSTTDASDSLNEVKSRSGYTKEKVSYGGRSSVDRQLYLDDVFGWAVNYAEPVNQQLSDQTSMEMFLNIQLAQNIALTPSFQLLVNPALNPQHDRIQIYGLRFRVTL